MFITQAICWFVAIQSTLLISQSIADAQKAGSPTNSTAHILLNRPQSTSEYLDSSPDYESLDGLRNIDRASGFQSGSFNASVSAIVMGFIADYTGGERSSPVLNLSSNCNNVENCEEVARDIKVCQRKGIKVFLSMGGSAGPYHRQKWDPDVLAWWIWNKFLGGDDRTLNRPFGDVLLDGIDFDPEGTDGEGYDQLVDTLRKLFKTAYPPRNYLITAAPQCPDLEMYSMNAMYPLLHPNPKYNAYPDLVFVQFYNNYCSANTFGSKGSVKFNFDEWEKWSLQNTNGQTKIYLGLMGKENHMDTGYVNYEKLTEILDTIVPKQTFGGVMMWDARYAFSNPVSYLNGIHYGQAVAEYLQFLSRTDDIWMPLLALDTASIFRDTMMPLMVPISHKIASLHEPLECHGQTFLLLRTVTSRILAESFGLPGSDIDDHLLRLGIDPVAPIVPGSRICLGPGQTSDTLAVTYVYNATSIVVQPHLALT
ncbi:glycoside hydrolase superfamily [Phycomyces nitens]|nr:glycoside hydrolase superfamily [Phycomyces nitens]